MVWYGTQIPTSFKIVKSGQAWEKEEEGEAVNRSSEASILVI
jgi:hypothetical protein